MQILFFLFGLLMVTSSRVQNVSATNELLSDEVCLETQVMDSSDATVVVVAPARAFDNIDQDDQDDSNEDPYPDDPIEVPLPGPRTELPAVSEVVNMLSTTEGRAIAMTILKSEFSKAREGAFDRWQKLKEKTREMFAATRQHAQDNKQEWVVASVVGGTMLAALIIYKLQAADDKPKTPSNNTFP